MGRQPQGLQGGSTGRTGAETGLSGSFEVIEAEINGGEKENELRLAALKVSP